MDDAILINIKNLSIQIIVLSLIVYVLTYALKLPIKRMTQKFEENTRKAVNTVIVLIPIVLSIVSSLVYYGVFKSVWLSSEIFELAGSVYVVATCIHAIISRISVLFNAIKNGMLTKSEVQETLKNIKQDIKAMNKALEKDNKESCEINVQIKMLLEKKKLLCENDKIQEIAQIERIDNQIEELRKMQENIENDKLQKQTQIENLNLKIKEK